MKGIVLAGLLVVGFPAAGQNVIVKCVDAEGRVMYVSGSCEPGQRVSSYKTYEGVRDDPQAAERARQAQLEVDARRSTYGNRAQAAYIPPQARPPGCEAAKAHRESVLKAVGLRRNYDLLQQLDENVRRACK